MGRKALLILFVIVVAAGVAIRRFPHSFLFSGKKFLYDEKDRDLDLISFLILLLISIVQPFHHLACIVEKDFFLFV